MNQFIKSKIRKDKKDHFAIIIITLLTVIIYFNSLGNSFVFDDDHVIVKNSYIKDPNKFLLFFTSNSFSSAGFVQGIRPILMLSFAFNYFFGRLNPIGYHIINIMFHFLNGIIIFFLIKILLSKSNDYSDKENDYSDLKKDNQGKYYWPALLASLIFIVHPVNTEAVDYISCRSTLMASFFLLLAFFLYIKKDFYLKPRNLYFYIGSLTTFILGLLTKEIVIVFPLTIILYELLFVVRQNTLKENFYRLFRFYLLFFIIASFYFLCRKYLFGAFINIYYIRSIYSNILTQIHVSAFYIKLLFMPNNLCIGRFFPTAKSILQMPVLISALITLLLIIIALLFSKREKLISFAIFWYFINLIPKFVATLNLVAAEHHLYLPAVGFYLIIARVITVILNKLINLKLKFILKTMVILILIFLSLFTINRNKTWKDTFSIWRDAVRISPKSIGAINNLGLAYLNRGQIDEAIDYFKKALNLKPSFLKDVEVNLRGNLSEAYRAKGLYDDAIEETEKALQIDPYRAELYNNLGLLYRDKGLVEEAIKEFKKAIDLDPNLPEPCLNLGVTYWHKNDFDLAILQFKNAIKANPDYIDAYYVLAKAYEDKGRLNEAKDTYEKILTLNPNNFQDHYTLGVVYGKLGDSRAIVEFKKAIKLNPEFAQAHNNLAVSYAYLAPPKIELAKKHLDLAVKYGYKPDPKFLSYLGSLSLQGKKH